VTLSAAHNINTNALKAGITYNTKVGGGVYGYGLGAGGEAAAAAGSCGGGPSGASLRASSRRAPAPSPQTPHHAASRPQLAGKKTTVKGNYLTKGSIFTGEVATQLAANKRTVVAFNKDQVRRGGLWRRRGEGVQAGRGGRAKRQPGPQAGEPQAAAP
jgi:hypothetical protein